jgi:hypothetical protein
MEISLSQVAFRNQAANEALFNLIIRQVDIRIGLATPFWFTETNGTPQCKTAQQYTESTRTGA